MSEEVPPPSRPSPIVTDDSAVFWDAAAEGRLVAQACADCGLLRHPPRPMCPACGSLRHDARALSGCGTVHSYSILHYPPNPRFEYPVIGVLVDLDEGVRVLSNLTGVAAGDVRIGQRVEAHFVPTQTGATIPVFRPSDT